MKVKAFEIFNAQSIDGMEWEDILQIVPMGNGRAIVLMKDQKTAPKNDRTSTFHAPMETYEDEFNKRCKEALYDDFGGTEKIQFSYKESDTQHIDDVYIVFYECGRKDSVFLDLTKRPEVYKYIAFKSEGDEL